MILYSYHGPATHARPVPGRKWGRYLDTLMPEKDGPTLNRGSFRLLLTSVHFSLFQVPGRSGLWWSGAVVLAHQKVLDQRRVLNGEGIDVWIAAEAFGEKSRTRRWLIMEGCELTNLALGTYLASQPGLPIHGYQVLDRHSRRPNLYTWRTQLSTWIW